MEKKMDIKDNKIELLEEDLECIRMYLDDLKIPRTDKDDKEYSIVGRIKWQQERMYSEKEVLDLLKLRLMFFGVTTSHYENKQWFEQFKKK